MKNNNLIKLYAAYKSGFFGDNILNVYFPFFGNIIYEENTSLIDEVKLAEKFYLKYHFPLPLTFIRQVLGVGMDNGLIIVDHGHFIAKHDSLKPYQINDVEFDRLWAEFITSFKEYCSINELELSDINIDECILDFLDTYDENILDETLNISENGNIFEYALCKFIKDLSSKTTQLFNFIVALSASNINKQAMFYTGNKNDSYQGLNVYLDSPMIFALLDMDSSARTASCKMLVEEAQMAGCIVQVLDHNFNEINGILVRAASWAISPDYDISKANNAARYFHDKEMNSQEIFEFCESVEEKLNSINITIKKTDYNVYQDTFQESETKIYNMIEEKYHENSLDISEEMQNSIKIDVRSIVMIYRERQGQTSTRIQCSRHLMLSLNSAIANVCKKYESNQSINAGHIPACISADLFGAVLWLFTPVKMMEYQKKRLLADCFAILKPSKIMLTKYVESLKIAKAAGDIDEKKFLFMRSHAVVNDALMNITKGDYARFNERSYLDVYNDIVAGSEKKYKDEKIEHENTKIELDKERQLRAQTETDMQSLKNNQTEINAKMSCEIQTLSDYINDIKQQKLKKKCTVLGWLLTIGVFGVPYIFVNALIEIVKSKLNTLTSITIIKISILLVLTVILTFLFKKGKNLCFDIVEKHLKE